ncbi:MAG: alginate export family protein [Cytophagales bacterium]|nr:alginate export family protein [Cytophagales bacterium]
MSISTSFQAFSQFVPAQPMLQLPGVPLWTINAQVRPRGEIRHGLANPVAPDAPPAAFVSQRTNLNLGFRWDKLNFNMDMRDVRVWGQDASSINNADGNKLFLHQAWGEFTLATTADTNCKLKIDNFSVKVGRQEIMYEDSRLLGNLDWLQQGRRHDAAIVKFLHKGYQADMGFAYNQNTDAFGYTGTQYIGGNGVAAPGPQGSITTNAAYAPTWVGPAPSTNALSNQYKWFQYLYLARRFNQTRVSLMVFKDDFQKFVNSSPSPGVFIRTYSAHNDVKSRVTFGGQMSTQIGNSSEGIKTAISGGVYGQMGANPRRAENATAGSDKLNAAHAFAYITFSKGKWSLGPGYDLLTGNSTEITGAAGSAVTNVSIGSENNQFDPLYGTPHRWWGYMDYFYVGTGAPTAGLSNYYIKAKYTENKWFISADLHHFMTAGKTVRYRASGTDAWQELGQNYGQELDLIFNYQANRFTNVEFGCSFMLATETLAASKGFKIGTTGEFNQWGYLMINIRPDFLFQKPVAIKN